MFREDGSKSVVFALVVLTFFCGETSSKCMPQTPCSCMFPDGQGYNLTHLVTLGPLTATIPSSNSFFQFHPCTNTQMNVTKDSECGQGKGVSMCLVDGNHSISLGTVEETSMDISSELTKPSLILAHKNHITKVDLYCCDNCTTSLVSETDTTNELNYHLILLSPFSCKQQLRPRPGLSTGSLLVIYFFIFTGTYFTGGAIALNLLRGARGWEMVPNHKFWRDLPSLVRDGIEYTFSCCYSGSYDRI